MDGYTPDSIVPDAPIYIGDWSPQNYGRSYSGSITLMTALAHSINTVPVRLAQAVTRDEDHRDHRRHGHQDADPHVPARWRSASPR